MITPWTELESRARQVLDDIFANLPAEILPEAEKVPCLFQEVCADDPDLLGTYGDFVAGEVSPANGPIILYLRAIEDFSEVEEEDFEDQVRLTYLHELGHHLGWDEGDLEARGLA